MAKSIRRQTWQRGYLAGMFAPVSLAFESFVITFTGVALLTSDHERIKRREVPKGIPFADLSQMNTFVAMT